MSGKTPSTGAVLKYALLQIPGWILLFLILRVTVPWVDLPAWIVPCLVGIWIAKDVLMFPLVWKAYESGPEGGADSFIGETAVVAQPLEPSGYVRVQGELWRAEARPFESAVEKGEKVLIREVRGLTLIVESLRTTQGAGRPHVAPGARRGSE